MTEDEIPAYNFRHSTRAGTVKYRSDAESEYDLELQLLYQHSWLVSDVGLSRRRTAKV
jgi:hypothetical protein